METATMLEQSAKLREGTDKLLVDSKCLLVETDGLRTETDGLRTETDELMAQADKLIKQVADLMLTRAFTINLSDCFLEYQQFISQETGDVKRENRLPIRAYCPEIYWGHGKKDDQILREIHIKILNMQFYEYPSKYDLKAANEMLWVIINGYKKGKRIRLIAQDDCDGTDYWYFQLYVSENQECIDLAKQIVSKWLQIVYKQPLSDICPVNY